MKSLELFTGAGGLALGTHLAGFDHVGLLEWNHDACNTLRLNAAANALPGISHWQVEEADIKTVDFARFRGVELVAGGVPCQPFSIGGKHKGMDDSRDMFPDFVRAIRTLQPRAFIVENVKGLLRQSFRNYFSYIVLQLTHPDVEHALASLRHAEVRSVPQTRERVFIVGFRSDVGVDWHFPEPTHSEEALLRAQFITGDYWTRHGIRKPKNLRTPGAGVLARAASEEMFPAAPWKTVRDAVSDLPKPSDSREHPQIANHRVNPGARAYVGHTGSFIDWPSKTLKAGVHGVPGGENMIAFSDGSVRYLTVREAARVQTFPDLWRFEGAWSEAMRQLGNAVPVELAGVVAKSVAEKLQSQRSSSTPPPTAEHTHPTTQN